MGFRLCSIILFVFMVLQNALHAQQTSLRYPRDGYHGLKKSIRFHWSGESGAAYEFELDDDPSFAAPVVSLSGLSNPATVFASWPDTGVYFWRARAMGGTWSASRSVRIVDPLEFPSLRLWLRSDTGLVMNGNTISQWKDISGSGNHVEQTVAAKQPTRIAVSYNQKPTLFFDGNDHLINSAFPYDIDNTAFMCGRKTGGSGYGTFLSSYNFNFEIQADYCHFQTQPNQVIAGYNTDTLTVIQLARQSGNTRVFADGELVGLNQSTLIPLQTNVMKLGFQNNSVSQLVGHISEVLFFNEILSDSYSAMLNNYLMDRYAPPVFLGNDTSVVAGFCPIQLSLPAGYYYPIWSDGSTGSNLLVSETGTFWVEARDYFGRIHRDTIRISYPEPFNLSSQTVCAGSPLVWNPGVGGVTILWQDGSNTPSFAITQTGLYWFVAQDGQGCSYHSDTATVVVDAFSQATLGPDTLLCGGNMLQLNPQNFPGTSFLWNTGETLASISVDTSGTYVLQASNANNCFIQDSITITVVGIAPLANFSFQETCSGNAVLFNDLSVPTPGEMIASWEWTFSNGQADSIQNPVATFQDTGIYSATLKVVSSQGCGAILTQNVTSYAKPVAWFAHLNACENAAVQFLESANGFNGTVSSFAWNFGDPSSGNNTSVLPNPVHLFSSIGLYTVQLIVTNQVGCMDTILQTLQVKPAPEAGIQDLSFCEDSIITLQSVSIVSFPWIISSSEWVVASDTLSGSQVALPMLNHGIYPLMLAVAATNGCRDTLQTQLEIRAVPNAKMEIRYPCINQYSALISGSTCACVIDSIAWQLNQTFLGSLQNQPIAFTDTTSALITLSVFGDNGCSGSIDTLLTPGNPPVASFSLQPPFTAPGNEVQGIAENPETNVISWIIEDNQIEADTLQYTFQDTGLYEVLMVMTNPYGCIDTASSRITVFSPGHDLSLLSVELIEDSLSYRFSVRVANLGTVKENMPRIAFTTDLETGISEVLDFSLLPGEVRKTELQSSFSKLEAGRFFICMRVMSSSLMDMNPDNNEQCMELTAGDLLRSVKVYPNPASEHINWQVYSPLEQPSILNLYNPAGILEKVVEITLKKGINRLGIPLDGLASGLYSLRLSAAGSLLGERFLLLKKP